MMMKGATTSRGKMLLIVMSPFPVDLMVDRKRRFPVLRGRITAVCVPQAAFLSTWDEVGSHVHTMN